MLLYLGVKVTSKICVLSQDRYIKVSEYFFRLNKYGINELNKLNLTIEDNSNIEGNEHNNTNNKLKFPIGLSLIKIILNLCINLLTNLKKFLNPQNKLLNIILFNPQLNISLINS